MSAPGLMKIKAAAEKLPDPVKMGWQAIATAPFDRDLELAVIDADGPHALVFPCRRTLRGWIKAGSNERVDVHPTHWRDWQNCNSALFSFSTPLQRSGKL
jgi:hypothetical protein